MIGNAHIDPVWLWTAAEGRQETLDTCRSALDRMEETEGFVFCCSTAAGYRWIEETAPGMFAEIAKRIAQGRWVVVGGWWVQPDCNIPSGESLIRQGLVGLQYLRERFGAQCTVGYNVDTFGHPWTLAQLLPGMGLKYYVFFRPGPHEKELPGGLFWWEGPDGTRTLTARPPGHYNTGPDDIEWRVREAAAQMDSAGRDGMAFYGVGNHGGGPTQENLRSIQRLMGDPDLPEIRFSHPEAFFENVLQQTAEWPVVRDELQHHARGCYTSVAAIKALNRRAEDALQDAEFYSCLAEELARRPIDRQALRQSWETVLFNQFHDILAGTSIRAACEDTLRENGLVIDQCHAMSAASARAVAARIAAPPPGQSLMVFNPLGWTREEPVEAEINWREHGNGLTVETLQGEAAPCQITRSVWSGGGRSVRILVKPRIKACGYTTLRVLLADGGEGPAAFGDTREMSNGLLHVKLGSGTEWIREIVDLETGISAVNPGCGTLIVLDDPSDTWSHDVARFREEIGRFEMVGDPEMVEAGPLRWTARAEGKWGDSWICQYISLSSGRTQVDVRVEVDWHERHRMAKLSVPTRVEADAATFDVAYGAISRLQTGDEEPGQRWVDVSGVVDGAAYGVALLNDCKYGFDALGGEIRMSVVRSPIYAFHDPAKVQPGEAYEYTDQGLHVFRYSIVPHAGDWRDAGVPRLAAEFNRPCLALHEPARGTAGDRSQATGDRERLTATPREFSLAATDRPNVDIETVKPAEQGEGIAIRLRETFGRTTQCVLTIAGETHVPLDFRGWEIKTLVAVRTGGVWNVRETNLLEQ
jgi:alpha-mannosidase